MKKLLTAIQNRHSAMRERNPGMPTLRQHVRMAFCVVLMLVAFTCAARNPETRLQIGGMVAGFLALMTTIGVMVDGVKPGDFGGIDGDGDSGIGIGSGGNRTGNSH
jgi:hypothetical protein